MWRNSVQAVNPIRSLKHYSKHDLLEFSLGRSEDHLIPLYSRPIPLMPRSGP
jgi:hypothetical protein